MSDLDPYRGKRRHVQFKMRADLYARLERLCHDRSVGVAARDLLERMLESMNDEQELCVALNAIMAPKSR